jgi:two-component system, NtrC family, sensor histidine kinase HydH
MVSTSQPVNTISSDTFMAIFQSINDALAIHQVLLDDSGTACEVRCLEVNHAFELLSGLNRSQVIGQPAGVVIPGLDLNWPEIYRQVAVSGEAFRFSSEPGVHRQPVQVTVSRHQPGVVISIFSKEPGRGRVRSPAASTKAGQDNPDLLDAGQLAKELQKSQALFEISQTLAGTVDLKKTLQQIADAAHSLIKASNRTILHLLDESGRYLKPVAVSGDSTGKLMPLNFKPGQGIAGIVVSTGEAINVGDVMVDRRYIPLPSSRRGNRVALSAAQAGVRALLVVPVKTGSAILGTLSVQSPISGVFSEDDLRLLTALGAQAALAIEKARLYDDLQAALQHEKATRAQLVQAEKLVAIGRIVASVAHELNNPLQAIQNALYLIQMEASLSGQARDDLHTVLNETERMAGLIARLRDTYRPATHEEFQPESLNALVLDVQRLLSTHLRHSKINLEFIPDEKLPVFPIIRDQMKQVILNICLNAVEAMRDGGTIQIATELHRETQSVLLNISDNGPAIDPKILPIIFDPFVTTKASEGGTGLGLAITFDIVQRHMGRIEVDSHPGSGTSFKVWLPLEPRLPSTPESELGWG